MIDHVEYVDTDAQLAKLCANLHHHELIGLDTEFERTRTYFPRAALFQIADSARTYLIDPLVIKDWQPLVTVLEHPQITKVLHACSEDLELIDHFLDLRPSPLFDTQVAATFAGQGMSLGYRNLVAALLDVELAKDQTRSDWLGRPLSEEQVQYASADVRYLLPIHAMLSQRVAKLGRAHWLSEDLAGLSGPSSPQAKADLIYAKLGNTHRWGGRALAALRVLCRWREEVAREADRPRQRILPDKTLMAIARGLPESVENLRLQDLLDRKEWSRYGQAVIQLLAPIHNLPAQELPEPPPSPRSKNAIAPLLERLKETSSQRAEALDLPQALIVTMRQLEQLALSRIQRDTEGVLRGLPILKGWRREVLGNDLLGQVEEYEPQTP